VGSIVDQVSQSDRPDGGAVRCPICAVPNVSGRFCRHVRWTFDQGDPVSFARFALETSAYRHPRGYRPRDIRSLWWSEHGEWVVERVLDRFAAIDGYVFGEPADLDLLALDVWRAFEPEPARPAIDRG
jgi:hypothetical protein